MQSTAVIHIFFLLALWPFLALGGRSYNLVDYGAKAGAKTDSSTALRKSWAAACSLAGFSTIYVPSGKFLVASPVIFHGGSSCKSDGITFRIDGVLVAPSDYRVLASASATWLSFENVDGVSISGGTIDGQGSGLWSCKKGSNNNCPSGVTTLMFTESRNIVINGLKSLNSQLYHIVFNGCNNVKLDGVIVSASGQSPNTDGIHVQESTGVTILHTHVSTGDDCVSIGPGTKNLWIENFACGPGHGISIGSLGKQSAENGVHNVTVKTVVFTGTTNGVRIKSWARASSSFVRNVLFQHATMVNVQNPIIIDQHYCPNGNGCPNSVSGVKISNITYDDIHGTSATQVAVKFDCSSKYPCTDIRLEDVKLTYGSKAARSSCANARGDAYGLVQPSSCL
ncbi:hypothetical protein V2J09_014063 [Rumex salicifolius]